MHQHGIHVIISVTADTITAADAQGYSVSLEINTKTTIEIRHGALAGIVASGVVVIAVGYRRLADICIRVLEFVLIYRTDVVVAFLAFRNQVCGRGTEITLVGVIVCGIIGYTILVNTFVMYHIVVCRGVTYGHTAGHYHAL